MLQLVAIPNCVALAALVYNLCILQERYSVCDFEVALCNIGFVWYIIMF